MCVKYRTDRPGSSKNSKYYFWMESMKVNIGEDWSHLNDKCSKLKLLKCS